MKTQNAQKQNRSNVLLSGSGMKNYSPRNVVFDCPKAQVPVINPTFPVVYIRTSRTRTNVQNQKTHAIRFNYQKAGEVSMWSHKLNRLRLRVALNEDGKQVSTGSAWALSSYNSCKWKSGSQSLFTFSSIVVGSSSHHHQPCILLYALALLIENFIIPNPKVTTSRNNSSAYICHTHFVLR